MKFTFVSQDESMESVFSGVNEYPLTKRTHEFSAENLDDILDQIEMFLKGSGFIFNHLQIANDPCYDETWNTPADKDDLLDVSPSVAVPKMKSNK
jgi:hypothetical protein